MRLFPRPWSPPFPRGINNTLKRVFRTKVTSEIRVIIEYTFHLLVSRGLSIGGYTFRLRHISQAMVDFFWRAAAAAERGLESLWSLLIEMVIWVSGRVHQQGPEDPEKTVTYVEQQTITWGQ